ncbi:MAG: hypothetical protein CUN55_07615 [Phototrophicales bacterium]|nr:MAG: hypothetical protein CUN55_07615 [Phototrophicales bacterium]
MTDHSLDPQDNLELEVSPETSENEEASQSDENPFREFIHHQRIALEELGRAVESLLPKEFREHAGKAGRAFLDSFKVFVDATRETVENMTNQSDEEETSSPENKNASTKIKVEVE